MEEGGKADLLGAGGPRHRHEGHGDLEQALHRHNLKVAHVVVTERAEDEIDHAHLDNELGNGQEHPRHQAFLLALEVVGIAAEIRLEPVDGLIQPLPLPQKPHLAHQPFGKPAEHLGDRFEEQGHKKQDGKAVDDNSQNGERDNARVFRLKLAVHPQQACHGDHHKPTLEAHKLHDEHRCGNAHGDFVPEQIRRLHGLSPCGAGGDVGVVQSQEGIFLAAEEADMVPLAAEQQPEDLPFKNKVHQNDQDAQRQESGSEVADGVKHIAELPVEHPKQQHRHDGGANVEHAPVELPLLLLYLLRRGLFPRGKLSLFLFHCFHASPFRSLKIKRQPVQESVRQDCSHCTTSPLQGQTQEPYRFLTISFHVPALS